MGKSVIVCVDDEPIVLKGLESQLGRIFGKDYIIEFAENGEEALDIINEIQENGDIFPLIISDQLMPGIKGNELLKKIHAISNETFKILLTGQADAAAVGDAVNNAKLYRYISKPWEAEDLILTVKEALNSYTQKKQIEEQNRLLKKHTEELEEEVNKRTAEIQQAHNNITDSINYASLIQKAIMPAQETLDEFIPDNFVFFKPCDIVSGDFFWWKKFSSVIYLAAVDCTGHGVPGAFMSMLGISLLNDIVKKRYFIPPAIVLDELRKRLKKSLNQTQPDQDNIRQDGMDIALCLYNFKTKLLQYAGAYNSLLIVNAKTKVLREIKADRMPVGSYPKDHINFTNHEVNLNEDDVIYLYSDGYASQFGDKGKFKMSRFKELLISICNKPFGEQKTIIKTTLAEWQGNNNQIDDILVIGCKIQN